MPMLRSSRRGLHHAAWSRQFLLLDGECGRRHHVPGTKSTLTASSGLRR